MPNLNVEVLSPVGSPDSLEAAVRSGADAVYIGAKDFSARRNAENFNTDELKIAVEYCHIRGVKVYLTLNIMIKQSELLHAFRVAADAINCGVDAIIVQDLGLARMLHKYLPQAQLHASTQMTVHSVSALPLLKQMGFKRVVLAREMSAKAIREFCDEAKKNDIEVEVFVHGALCMSVSGQCLMSSVLGGRSGNRGLCAGPCRLPFEAQNGTGYDLSLKDNSLYEHITELIEIGVTSLKIEGRMKRPEYVAAATAACRQAVDAGKVDLELAKTLQGVFSRSGFTDGYFTGKLGREMFGIRTKDDVTAAKDTFSILHSLYRAERQHIKIDIDCEILPEKQVKLSVSDGINSVAVTGEIPQAAKSKALDYMTVKQNITKLGNTPYVLGDLKLTVGDNLYLSASALNSLRRDAIEKLDKIRSNVSEAAFKQPVISAENSIHGDKKIIARFSSIEQIPQNLKGMDAIMLPSECDFSFVLNRGKTLIAELPRFILDEQALFNALVKLREIGVENAYCSNLASVTLAKRAKLRVIGGIGLNICNGESVLTAKDFGVDYISLSPEITLDEIKRIPSLIPKCIFAYGRLPLMLTRNCPIKNGTCCDKCDKRGYLTDRKNVKFPVMCRQGYSEVLNSAPIYLADRLQEITDVDYMILHFTNEESSECERIIREYVSGGRPKGDFTRGLYYRNLI